MPQGYVYTKRGGWTKVKSSKSIDYDKMVEEDGESWRFLLSFFVHYPDYFLDICKSERAEFDLQLFQRVELRARARNKDVFTSGPRGFTKTFISFISLLLDGVFWPGSKCRYVGPADNQQAALADDAWKTIKRNYPALANQYLVKNNGSDTFKIYTELDSVVNIDSTRGDNCHELLLEEVGQEEYPRFNHENYRRVVQPTCRLQYMVDSRPDPTHIDFKIQAITTASRQQNEAFTMRNNTRKAMNEGGKAWAVDYPWQVPVLTWVRPYSYYAELKDKLTPEEFLRECGSRYTGTSENPIVRDTVLMESRQQQCMEIEHCGDPEAVYVIGYDVSYADGAHNAKCATSVIKGVQQGNFIEKARYLKTLVYVEDSAPKPAEMQARILKQKWAAYSLEGGKPTQIAIDAWQYGKAVVEQLHEDLGDGLPPLCCRNHEFLDLELPGALPVIYAVKEVAGSGGSHDPTSVMLRYSELEWEHGNIRLLTSDINAGVEAYKALHGIKDDYQDGEIALPYLKTREMCEQIANLKKKVTGISIAEHRISGHINRDMWSSTKYALRVFELLEYELAAERHRKKSDWDEIIKDFEKHGYMGAQGVLLRQASTMNAPYNKLIVPRIGGEGWHGGRMRQ